MGDRLSTLADVVSERVLLDAVEASRRLTELGIPHALIGGLAVGVHGYPRTTKDVDFLVGAEAFERSSPVLAFRPDLRDLVRVGVVDLMPLPKGLDELESQLSLPMGAEIPVIGVEGLILLKLLADRPQDRADVGQLIAVGLDIGAVTAYLRRAAPQLVAAFAEIVAEGDP